VSLTATSRAAPHALRIPAGRAPSRSVLLSAVVTAALLFVFSSNATLGATTVTATCDSVNLRTGPSTTYAIKTSVKPGAALTVVTKVAGGSYGTTCNGVKIYGSNWYRVSAINGKTVSSLYGVSYVYGASALFKAVTVAPTATPKLTLPATGSTPAPSRTPAPTATPTPTPVTTTYASNCDSTNLRSGPSTTYPIKVAVAAGTKVTVVSKVTGGSYATTCLGKAVSGSSWLKISALNGKSVSSQYGVSYVYGASGLFSLVPTPTPTPLPTPAPTTDPNATPGPTPTPGIVTLPDKVTVYGRGYGHGVGMSQYGAYGRALAGYSYSEILSHYYYGTHLGTTPNSQIRVLVLQSFAASAGAPVEIYGRGGSWTIDGISTTFPVDARLRFVPTTSGSTTTWRVVVNSSNGTQLYNAASSSSVRVRPGSGTTLQLWSRPSAYDRYRGVLRIIGSIGAGATANVVNELPLETYLKGVVPAEMPASWPAAAVKAQAIAARSYAAYHLHPSSGSYDVKDNTSSQVYLGVLGEKSGGNSAISATAGKVVRTSSGSIANTLFHSAAGGATESNENVFTSSTGAKTAGVYSYLRGVMERRADHSAYDDASPYATWKTRTYTLAQIQAWFAADSRTNVGTLVALDLRNRGFSGRLISVTLIGANGTTRKVSGDVFRKVFNAHRPSGDPIMRSTLFDLAFIP
jgi:stage II sporulation protein D